MDIVLSRNGVKCAVFKISDVQIKFVFTNITKIIKLLYIVLTNTLREKIKEKGRRRDIVRIATIENGACRIQSKTL